jgi:hypothetical protein
LTGSREHGRQGSGALGYLDAVNDLRPHRQLNTYNEEHDMEYRLLGRTGVSVSPLCLGTMMFGPWGNDDRADAVRVIHRALDAGINFVDTADLYSGGVSEEITGAALRGRRDDVVLATKFFMPMDGRPNRSGGSRKWIMQEAENSLWRLKTDYIPADHGAARVAAPGGGCHARHRDPGPRR